MSTNDTLTDILGDVWDATANNIMMDYTSIDIDGTTYYYR